MYISSVELSNMPFNTSVLLFFESIPRLRISSTADDKSKSECWVSAMFPYALWSISDEPPSLSKAISFSAGLYLGEDSTDIFVSRLSLDWRASKPYS